MSKLREVGRLGVAMTALAVSSMTAFPASGALCSSPHLVGNPDGQTTTRAADAGDSGLEGLTIARLEFTGNRRVRDRTLYRIFGVEPGGHYSAKAIAEGVRRLNESGKFELLTMRDVVVTADRDTAVVEIEVRVKER